MDEKLQILYDQLLTISSSILDFGLKQNTQISFTLENVIQNGLEQINSFLDEYYETEWKWGRYEFIDGNFKGTADLPENLEQK